MSSLKLTACLVFADPELLARTNVLHYYQKKLHVHVYQVGTRLAGLTLPVLLPTPKTMPASN